MLLVSSSFTSFIASSSPLLVVILSVCEIRQQENDCCVELCEGSRCDCEFAVKLRVAMRESENANSLEYKMRSYCDKTEL